MATVRTGEIKQSDILRLEAEMNNLWGELNTSNIPHAVRVALEQALGGCEEQFKAVLGGQASYTALESKLHEIDMTLASATLEHAEYTVPKSAHSGSAFQALENVRKELKAGSITPLRARHEVKEIMRPHA